VNQQAREEQNNDVATELVSILKGRPIDAQHNYKSKEVSVETITVSHSDILAKHMYTLNLLDAEYTVSAESLLWQFPD